MKNVFIYWLIIISILIIIAGLIFAFIAPYFMVFIQDIFYQSFSNNSIVSVNINDKNHINWIYGVLGGTLAGWGVMIFFLSLNLLKGNNKSIWNSILLSVIVWFIIDTIITIKYGVIINLLLNICILLSIIVPYIGNSVNQKNKLTTGST